MSIDVLQFNAIAKKIEVKRNTLKEKTACRDSAIAAQLGYDSDIAYYQALIDSADSFIANTERSYGFTPDSDHFTFYSNQCSCVGYKAIKDLADFADSSGAITCTFCVGQFTNCWAGGCCCNFVPPNGVTRLGIEIQAPGGPSKMVNCCGVTNWGPTGSYLAVVLCIDSDAGDTDLTLCSGCACHCFPYCCGYPLYQSCPAYVCGTLNGNDICLRVNSPKPLVCAEQKSRYYCARSLNSSCAAELCATNGNYGNCSGWSDYCPTCNNNNGLKKFWYSQCGCGSGSDQCGSSVCSESYATCFLTRCLCEVCNPQNIPHVFNSEDINFCIHYDGDGTDADNVSTPLNSIMVTGSCFSVPGLYNGGSTANTCIWNCHPGVPFCRGAGFCCKCMNQCCPGCLMAACNCANRQIPGLGGEPSLACGGGTGLYSDRGKTGAIRIKYC